MGFPPTPSPSHLYPQALQLKLYQAFIFSIPILFSIILFLLFYLFYLKRRASALSYSPQVPPAGNSNQPASYVSSVCQIILKEDIKEKLPIVLFDEELRTKDSQCCVCLGEFEMKEELLQIPSCKHVFHIECIHHWLHSNSTCPLCRRFVIFPATKPGNTSQHSGHVLPQQDSRFPYHLPLNLSSEQLQQQDHHLHHAEHLTVPVEGSSGVTTQLMDYSTYNGSGSSSHPDSYILHVQTHEG